MIRLFAMASFLLFSGCAVQNAPNGHLNFSVDEAEMFGKVIGTFKLEDDSEGRLRVYNNRYSVKLQNRMRVIPLEGATFARLVTSKIINERTVVAIETSERSCPYKTQLLSIQGSEILSWSMGDCKTQPKITMGEDEATFDHLVGNLTVRLTYRDGRLLRSEFPTVALQTGPRHVPGLAVPATVARTAAKPAANATSSPSPTSGVTKTAAPVPTAAPAPAKQLTFSNQGQEQKPVRIVLDR